MLHLRNCSAPQGVQSLVLSNTQMRLQVSGKADMKRVRSQGRKRRTFSTPTWGNRNGLLMLLIKRMLNPQPKFSIQNSAQKQALKPWTHFSKGDRSYASAVDFTLKFCAVPPSHLSPAGTWRSHCRSLHHFPWPQWHALLVGDHHKHRAHSAHQFSAQPTWTNKVSMALSCQIRTTGHLDLASKRSARLS